MQAPRWLDGRRLLALSATTGIVIGALVGFLWLHHTLSTDYTTTHGTVLGSSLQSRTHSCNGGKRCTERYYSTTVRVESRTVRLRYSQERSNGSTVTLWTSGNEVDTDDPHSVSGVILPIGISLLIAVVITLFGFVPLVVLARLPWRTTPAPAGP